MSSILRRVQPDEADALRAIDEIFSSNESAFVRAGERLDSLSDRLSEETHVIALESKDGGLIGGLELRLGYPDSASAQVFHVAVEPRSRHRGHGRTLVRFAEEHAARLGFPFLVANTLADNVAAQDFWISLEFDPAPGDHCTFSRACS